MNVTLTTPSTLRLRMRCPIPHLPYRPALRGDQLSTGNSPVRLETNLKFKKLNTVQATHLLHETSRLGTHGGIPPFPRMPSWRGALLTTDMT
jgi:hypothetical protein